MYILDVLWKIFLVMGFLKLKHLNIALCLVSSEEIVV